MFRLRSGKDADHVIGVQVNRVGIRRCAIAAAPAHNLPRPGPEEVFPRHRGEGRLDPRVPDATGCYDLLCKGAPDDFQFGLAIHLGCMAGEPVEAQNNMADASVPAHGQVMALPRGFGSILKTGLAGRTATPSLAALLMSRRSGARCASGPTGPARGVFDKFDEEIAKLAAELKQRRRCGRHPRTRLAASCSLSPISRAG